MRLKNSGESVRESEDEALRPEVPEVLRMAMDVLVSNKGLDAARISADLCINPGLLHQLVTWTEPPAPANNAKVVAFPSRPR